MIRVEEVMALTPLESQLLEALRRLVRECDGADEIEDVESEVSNAKEAIRDAERKR